MLKIALQLANLYLVSYFWLHNADLKYVKTDVKFREKEYNQTIIKVKKYVK